jgi:hypothetical protein
METTTEAPTEDGWYWAREKNVKTGVYKGWGIIKWREGQMLFIGSLDVESWNDAKSYGEQWERSVEPIQTPGD